MSPPLSKASWHAAAVAAANAIPALIGKSHIFEAQLLLKKLDVFRLRAAL